MKNRIVRYLKHILTTIIILASVAIPFGLYHGAALHYGHNKLTYQVDNQVLLSFYKNDTILSVNYLKENRADGFHLHIIEYPNNSGSSISCFFSN